jgi:hypothetical protein
MQLSTHSEENQNNNLKLNGSLKQAWCIDTLMWLSGYATVVSVSPAVNTMTKLSSPLAFILIAMPSVLSFSLQIPAGYLIDITGGISFMHRVRTVSVLGSIGLVVLSATTDLSTVNSADWRYGLLCLFGILIGSSGASYQLISNITYWSAQNTAITNRSTYAGVGGLAAGLSLLLLYFTEEGLGLAGSFAIFCGLLLISTLLGKIYLVAPYYHQLRAQNYSAIEAEQTAKAHGQFYFPSKHIESFLQTLTRTAFDRRYAVLAVGIYSSFGTAIFSSTSLYQILIRAVNMSRLSAILITAFGSIWSTIVRSLTGRLIVHYDKSSNGAYTFIISSILVMIGALILACPRPFPELAIILPAKFLFIDPGVGIGTGAIFQMVNAWSNPKNTDLNQYDVGMMSGLVGSCGGSGNIIFPLLTSLLVALNDIEGYSYSFVVTASLAFIAAILVLLMHLNVSRPKSYFFMPWKNSEQKNAQSPLQDIIPLHQEPLLSLV